MLTTQEKLHDARRMLTAGTQKKSETPNSRFLEQNISSIVANNTQDWGDATDLDSALVGASATLPPTASALGVSGPREDSFLRKPTLPTAPVRPTRTGPLPPPLTHAVRQPVSPNAVPPFVSTTLPSDHFWSEEEGRRLDAPAQAKEAFANASRRDEGCASGPDKPRLDGDGGTAPGGAVPSQTLPRNFSGVLARLHAVDAVPNASADVLQLLTRHTQYPELPSGQSAFYPNTEEAYNLLATRALATLEECRRCLGQRTANPWRERGQAATSLRSLPVNQRLRQFPGPRTAWNCRPVEPKRIPPVVVADKKEDDLHAALEERRLQAQRENASRLLYLNALARDAHLSSDLHIQRLVYLAALKGDDVGTRGQEGNHSDGHGGGVGYANSMMVKRRLGAFGSKEHQMRSNEGLDAAAMGSETGVLRCHGPSNGAQDPAAATGGRITTFQHHVLTQGYPSVTSNNSGSPAARAPMVSWLPASNHAAMGQAPQLPALVHPAAVGQSTARNAVAPRAWIGGAGGDNEGDADAVLGSSTGSARAAAEAPGGTRRLRGRRTGLGEADDSVDEDASDGRGFDFTATSGTGVDPGSVAYSINSSISRWRGSFVGRPPHPLSDSAHSHTMPFVDGRRADSALGNAFSNAAGAATGADSEVGEVRLSYSSGATSPMRDPRHRESNISSHGCAVPTGAVSTSRLYSAEEEIPDDMRRDAVTSPVADDDVDGARQGKRDRHSKADERFPATVRGGDREEEAALVEVRRAFALLTAVRVLRRQTEGLTNHLLHVCGEDQCWRDADGGANKLGPVSQREADEGHSLFADLFVTNVTQYHFQTEAHRRQATVQTLEAALSSATEGVAASAEEYGSSPQDGKGSAEESDTTKGRAVHRNSSRVRREYVQVLDQFTRLFEVPFHHRLPPPPPTAQQLQTFAAYQHAIYLEHQERQTQSPPEETHKASTAAGVRERDTRLAHQARMRAKLHELRHYRHVYQAAIETIQQSFPAAMRTAPSSRQEENTQWSGKGLSRDIDPQDAARGPAVGIPSPTSFAFPVSGSPSALAMSHPADVPLAKEGGPSVHLGALVSGGCSPVGDTALAGCLREEGSTLLVPQSNETKVWQESSSRQTHGDDSEEGTDGTTESEESEASGSDSRDEALPDTGAEAQRVIAENASTKEATSTSLSKRTASDRHTGKEHHSSAVRRDGMVNANLGEPSVENDGAAPVSYLYSSSIPVDVPSADRHDTASGAGAGALPPHLPKELEAFDSTCDERSSTSPLTWMTILQQMLLADPEAPATPAWSTQLAQANAAWQQDTHRLKARADRMEGRRGDSEGADAARAAAEVPFPPNEEALQDEDFRAALRARVHAILAEKKHERRKIERRARRAQSEPDARAETAVTEPLDTRKENVGRLYTTAAALGAQEAVLQEMDALLTGRASGSGKREGHLEAGPSRDRSASSLDTEACGPEGIAPSHRDEAQQAKGEGVERPSPGPPAAAQTATNRPKESDDKLAQGNAAPEEQGKKKKKRNVFSRLFSCT